MDRDNEQKLSQLRHELADIESERQQIMQEIARLEIRSRTSYGANIETIEGFCNASPSKDKIKLFRSLFRGREDVCPRRFESMKTVKSGYQPSC